MEGTPNSTTEKINSKVKKSLTAALKRAREKTQSQHGGIENKILEARQQKVKLQRDLKYYSDENY